MCSSLTSNHSKTFTVNNNSGFQLSTTTSGWNPDTPCTWNAGSGWSSKDGNNSLLDAQTQGAQLTVSCVMPAVGAGPAGAELTLVTQGCKDQNCSAIIDSATCDNKKGCAWNAPKGTCNSDYAATSIHFCPSSGFSVNHDSSNEHNINFSLTDNTITIENAQSSCVAGPAHEKPSAGKCGTANAASHQCGGKNATDCTGQKLKQGDPCFFSVCAKNEAVCNDDQDCIKPPGGTWNTPCTTATCKIPDGGSADFLRCAM
jgi:hypothetical protein